MTTLAAQLRETAISLPQDVRDLLHVAAERLDTWEFQRLRRQHEAMRWAIECFGMEEASSQEQRGLRHAEEAIELAQAVGCDAATLHKLIDHIYSNPPGSIDRELGGSGLTLILLADACGRSADQTEADELTRVLAKSREHFTERNHGKNVLGFRRRGT